MSYLSRTWTWSQFPDSIACASIGAADAIVSWRLAPDEVDYTVNDSGARVLFVGSELMPLVDKVRDRLTDVETVIEVTPDGAPGDAYEAWLSASERRATSCHRGGADRVLSRTAGGRSTWSSRSRGKRPARCQA